MIAMSNPKLIVNVQLRHHRFSVDAYDEMVARGILTSGDRVELLAGEIVETAPIGSRHAACVRRFSELFTLALAGQATVSAQSPIAIEVYVNPHRGTYIENRIVQSDAILMPLALPDLKFRVHDVLLPDG
jgi:hypothetical protein